MSQQLRVLFTVAALSVLLAVVVDGSRAKVHVSGRNVLASQTF